MTFKPYSADFDTLEAIVSHDGTLTGKELSEELNKPLYKVMHSLQMYKMITSNRRERQVYYNITERGRAFLATKEAVMKTRQV